MKNNILYKKLITIIIMSLFFLINSNVSAAEVANETLTDTMFNILWAALNLLYLITLPVLVIAGKAMDNSMIYWEFINLDKPLYMLWNLSRTFANFAIGWVILRKVVEYIFNFNEKNSPEFLKKLIIKWVAIVLWINFSWFILWALIDLSTIATYSLWAMPLSILKETNNKDMPILAVWSYFDYQSETSKSEQWEWNYIKPHTYYQWGNIYIPRCNEEWKLTKGLITWPEYFPTIPKKENINFNLFWDGNQYCALNTQTLADITELEKRKNDNLKTTDGIVVSKNEDRNKLMVNIINHISSSAWDCWDFNYEGNIYVKSQNNNAIKKISIAKSELIWLANSLVIGDWQISTKKYCNNTIEIKRNAYKENERLTWFLVWWWTSYSAENWLTMNTLINKSKWMVWPFITLYMSLLDFSNLSIQDTEGQTAATTLNWVTEFLLKSAISIALFIPLVALAITLIVRIVILRWIIAFIPLGIVLYGLKDEIKIWWDGMKTPSRLWWEELNAWNVLWLIFAPVLPVFTISISIIILQTLQLAMKPSIESNNKTRDFLWIVVTPDPNNENTSCMNFWWLQTTCMDKWTDVSSGSWFANFLPWLFINIFAIWLMWMMVKVALSWSKLTSKLWWDIMELWKNALWAIPLVNLWGKGVWATALSKIPEKMYNTANTSIDQYIRTQDKTLSEKLWLEEPEKTNDNNKWWSFSVTNQAEVQKSIVDQFKNNPITKDKNDIKFKEDILPRVKEAIKTWEKNDKSSNEFWNINATNQSKFVIDQINELMKEKKKLEKTITEQGNNVNEEIKNTKNNLDQFIKQSTYPTIEHWYNEFTKEGEIVKMNEFLEYINNPSLLSLLENVEDRNKLLTNFKNQITYDNNSWKIIKK